MTITTFCWSVLASLVGGVIIELIKYWITHNKNDRQG